MKFFPYARKIVPHPEPVEGRILLMQAMSAYISSRSPAVTVCSSSKRLATWAE
jgi:hypothetical protein